MRALMKSSVIKRSVKIAGRKTSVSIEDTFWTGLKEIAGSRRLELSQLVTEIQATRHQGNLSSALRVFVLEHFRDKDKQAGPSESAATVQTRDESTQVWRGFARPV